MDSHSVTAAILNEFLSKGHRALYYTMTTLPMLTQGCKALLKINSLEVLNGRCSNPKVLVPLYLEQPTSPTGHSASNTCPQHHENTSSIKGDGGLDVP